MLSAHLGAQELRLGSGHGVEPESALALQSEAEVQGVVAAFDWDRLLFVGLDLLDGPALEGADVVVRRVEPGFMVLGVVMDSDGRDNEVIRPGTSTLARARFRCLAPSAAGAVSSALTFRDGKYGAEDLGPLLENMITVGGQTISAREGLRLVSGSLTCPPAEPGRLRIRDTVAPPGSLCAPVDVLLDTPSPVQGFVLAIAHDPAVLRLTAITIAGTVTEASGADFSSSRILPGGGTLGVVLDLEPPYLGNTIPIGVNQTIARYSYCCLVEPPPGGPDTVSVIRFADGPLGDPPLENLLVVGGRTSLPGALVPGNFTCRARSSTGEVEFQCGADLDPATGKPTPIVGFPGSTVKVCFYYRSIPEDTPQAGREGRIQGLSMALCYDPRLVECRDGTFSVSGTIVEAVGAEFVNHHCENSTEDGDPGELVIGILVDALPPFDGQTLPPTRDLLRIGCIDFTISPGAPCNRCVPVEFCDGADGRGKVPTRNLISVDNFSVRPSFFNCEICVAATPVFQRGDCNWSDPGNLAVDLADPAAMISFLFGSSASRYHPPCQDACDANDDGRVDLADAVLVLRYLFRSGSPPTAPGPDQRGPDPTADQLSCEPGSICP